MLYSVNSGEVFKNNLEQMTIIFCINLDKHGVFACSIMTFYNLRHFFEFSYYRLKFADVRKHNTDVSTCLIAYFVGINYKFGAFDDSKISEFLNSLMNSST